MSTVHIMKIKLCLQSKTGQGNIWYNIGQPGDKIKLCKRRCNLHCIINLFPTNFNRSSLSTSPFGDWFPIKLHSIIYIH